MQRLLALKLFFLRQRLIKFMIGMDENTNFEENSIKGSGQFQRNEQKQEKQSEILMERNEEGHEEIAYIFDQTNTASEEQEKQKGKEEKKQAQKNKIDQEIVLKNDQEFQGEIQKNTEQSTELHEEFLLKTDDAREIQVRSISENINSMEPTKNRKKIKEKQKKRRQSTNSAANKKLMQRQKFKTYESEQKRKKVLVELKKSPEEVRRQLRKWSKQKQELRLKKSRIEAIVQKKLKVQSQELMQREKKRRENDQRERHEQILKNIQFIEERKKKRIEAIRQELQKESIERMKKQIRGEKQEEPLYKKMEKKYQNKLTKQEEQIRSKIATRKQEMLKQLQEIKRHQIQYMKNLKERRTKSVSSFKHPISDFNIYASRANDYKQQNMQKELRRKKFQEKVKSIPVIIDPEKQKQLLLRKDKRKNPLKYNYLSSVAALSDEKIYAEFKEFQIDLDKKEIGNQYMRSVNKQVLESRLKLSSIHRELFDETKENSEKSRVFKNYLPEVRALLKQPKKQENESKPQTQIQAIMMQHNTNSQRMAQFQKKSVAYENKAIKGIMGFRFDKEYSRIIEQQEQIDQNYIKSIKMRLAEASLTQ